MPPRRKAGSRSSNNHEAQTRDSQAGLGSLDESNTAEAPAPETEAEATPTAQEAEAEAEATPTAQEPEAGEHGSGNAAPGQDPGANDPEPVRAAAGESPPEENQEGQKEPHREEDHDMAEGQTQEEMTTQDEQAHEGGQAQDETKAIVTLKNAEAPSLLEIAERMPAPPETPTGFVMIDDPDLKDMMVAIHENTGGKGITQKLLERVSVPSGGGVQWRRETAGGEVVRRDTVDGVILHANVNRAYWSTSLEEDGRQPPDCYSNDGVTGSKYGACATCQFAQFGSGGGNRQACKKSMNLFMLEEDKMVPTVVQVPTMSIGEINANETEGTRYRRSYFTTDLLAPGVMKPFHRVVTSLGLDEAENNDGILYSVIKPKLGSIIDKEAYPRIDAIRSATLNLVQTNTEVEAILEGNEEADGSQTVDGEVVGTADGDEVFGDASNT